MSSSVRDRWVEVDAEGLWWYWDENNCEHGPYLTEEKATEAMQLHGLEE